MDTLEDAAYMDDHGNLKQTPASRKRELDRHQNRDVYHKTERMSWEEYVGQWVMR